MRGHSSLQRRKRGTSIRVGGPQRHASSARLVVSVLRRAGMAVFLTVPEEDQRHFALTSFVLGCVSIVAAIFPICGLPIAITGLLMGVYMRQTAAFRAISAWAITLSLIGLVLTLINIIVTIGIYFGTYVWQ